MKRFTDAYINLIDLYELYCYKRHIVNHIVAHYNTALN